jgi:hypothetical protein
VGNRLLTVGLMDEIDWPGVAKVLIRLACEPDGVVLPPDEVARWLDALEAHEPRRASVGERWAARRAG